MLPIIDGKGILGQSLLALPEMFLKQAYIFKVYSLKVFLQMILQED
jgi:hypothetical protein